MKAEIKQNKGTRKFKTWLRSLWIDITLVSSATCQSVMAVVLIMFVAAALILGAVAMVAFVIVAAPIFAVLLGIWNVLSVFTSGASFFDLVE